MHRRLAEEPVGPSAIPIVCAIPRHRIETIKITTQRRQARRRRPPRVRRWQQCPAARRAGTSSDATATASAANAQAPAAMPGPVRSCCPHAIAATPTSNALAADSGAATAVHPRADARDRSCRVVPQCRCRRRRRRRPAPARGGRGHRPRAGRQADGPGRREKGQPHREIHDRLRPENCKEAESATRRHGCGAAGLFPVGRRCRPPRCCPG